MSCPPFLLSSLTVPFLNPHCWTINTAPLSMYFYPIVFVGSSLASV